MGRRAWMRTRRELVLGTAVLAVLFVVVGGAPGGWEPGRMALLAAAGVVVGALAAPELVPEAFRHPRTWQAVTGAIAGLMLAAAFGNGPGHFLLGGVLGACAGFLARFWLDHVL